jgi:hypothetical protein
MSNTGRNTLKQSFKTGAIPSADDFASLIDSSLNKTDDGITIDAAGNLGLGETRPDARIAVKGVFNTTIGIASIDAGSNILTGGTKQFTQKLAAEQVIMIDGRQFSIKSITDDTHAELLGVAATAIKDKPVYVLADLLKITDGSTAGKTVFYISGDGNIGAGTNAPKHKLDVAGSIGAKDITGGIITAGKLYGDGIGITNIQASALNGKIPLDNLPLLKLNTITGGFSIEQDYDKELTGIISGTNGLATITGVGTLFLTELVIDRKVKIGDNIYDIESVEDDLALTLSKPLKGDLPAQKAYVGGNVFSIKNTNGHIIALVDGYGNLVASGNVTAMGKVAGDGSGLTNIQADALEGELPATMRIKINAADIIGVLSPEQIPWLDASKINSGVLDAARVPALTADVIPNLDASKINSGTFDPARIPALTIGQIPDIDALKITSGILDPTRIPVLTTGNIPNLDASKINSGTFDSARMPIITTDNIPNLDASKINSGTFDSARIPALAIGQIPDIDASKITAGTLAIARIPNLDTSKVNSGIFDLARIPALTTDKIPGFDASQVNSGTFDSARIPVLPIDKIPNLDTSKINSGIFDPTRMPALTTDKIPDLDAAKITAGTLNLSRIPVLKPDNIPNLDASKISSGTFAPLRIPVLTPDQLPLLSEIQNRLSVIETKLNSIITPADSPTIFWDFENSTSYGKVSKSGGAIKGLNDVYANFTQTGGGPAANFGARLGMVFFTNIFSEKNYPYIEGRTNQQLWIDNISFLHLHNHTKNYPGYPKYQVQLQIDIGTGFRDLGSAFIASSETHDTTITIKTNQALIPPGAFQIRWVPRGFARGNDSSTDYFALKNVSVTLSSPVTILADIMQRLQNLEQK